MSWTIILLILPSVLFVAYVVLAERRRRATQPELPGDWWPRFESEFRAYAERAASARRPPKPHGDAKRRPRHTTRRGDDLHAPPKGHAGSGSHA
ncbi:MAG: hypothetical protein JO321_08860 [Solirubrobacterales bacterium]|nr:hypothetical protein [Solirubrobacterales bacterium]